MKKLLLSLALLLGLGLGAWYYLVVDGAPPRVPFSRAARQTISSTISTNGKVEPASYTELHAESAGLIRRLLVNGGDQVAKGQPLLELSQPGMAEELQAAEAREAQAKAVLDSLPGGAQRAELAELDANLSRLRQQRETAQQRLESLQRLVQKQAATTFERDEARAAIEDLDAQMKTISSRRAALASQNDVAAAEARLREARAGVALVRSRTLQSTIQAPVGGVVYSLAARAGAFLTPGAAVASIGTLDPVKVRVYVDEPELGRVKTGQAVRITWDALTGREWTGTVGKMPTEIIALGSRQVGEVVCTIQNPGGELLPGTNVNAFILTEVVRDAITIPRTAMRRENGTGVYVLGPGNTTVWQELKTGASDALNIQVVSGLKEGDAVALPSDHALKAGEKITPVVPPVK